MKKIIAIANQKGGVGKTTTAVNLGVALTLIGKKVCLIDLDPQANMSVYLEYEDNDDFQNINDMMMSAVQGKSVDKSCIRHNDTNNIDYVPSDINLSAADFYLTQALARESVLKRILSADCFAEYDYIIIDCLPSLGVLLMNALTAADGVVIPVQTQKFALNGLQGLTDVIEQIKGTLNPSLEIIGILPTMLDNTNMSKDTINELTEQYSEHLMNTRISRSVEAAYSAEKCKSLCIGNTRLGEEYKALASEVLMRYGG
ncbi:MAG: ParA family protein [Oscillospiraceae bacterium]|nr:ParA family protein [Oscillospiraceae bacterium]